MNRFDRNSFESVEFLIESTEAPKIKAGGSSSSNILNRYFAALGQDLSLLATRANILASRGSRIATGCSEQGGALLSALSTVSTKVDSASSYSMVLADMHDAYYIDTGASTTVDINYTFGQTTLTPLSTTDLLVQTDAYGNNYVSPEVTWSFSTSSASSISDMSITDFTQDPEGIFMLKQEQVWVKSKLSGQTKGWIRIKAPLQFRGLTPNVLELHPFPAIAMKLRRALYRTAGDPEDTWTSMDLSYLPQYNSATQVVDKFGPVRLHLPNTPISEIVIELDVTDVSVWGMKQLKLYHREYDSTGVLTAEDPYSRTISTVTLRGKDPSSLSQLSQTKTGNNVAITLSTTNSSETPVITGVIMSIV